MNRFRYWLIRALGGELPAKLVDEQPRLFAPPIRTFVVTSILPRDFAEGFGEFLCDQIIEDYTFGHNERFYGACDAAAYALQSPMYGWNISNLKIYDVPRELASLTGLRATRFGAAPYDIKRAPQSWCYVEEQRKEDSRNDSV